jgi:ribonuclease P protein subunit RPR2
MRKRGNKPLYQVKIARERIMKLFEEAEKTAPKDIKLANRYVHLARKIGMRFNVRIPKHLKRRFCKYCYSYLLPGVTSKHSTKKGWINIKCLTCNKTILYPLKRKVKTIKKR